MKVAFFAPLKSPRHPTPSGDRRVARLLMRALDKAGFDVSLASELRLRSKPETQLIFYESAMQEVARLLQFYREHPESTPDLWFTYHHYYKAVDWLGSRIATELGIPYFLAEASHAPKRASDDWHFNHEGAEKIIRQAEKIFCLNKADKNCLRLLVKEEALIDLPPFIDIGAFAPQLAAKEEARGLVAADHLIDNRRPWIIAIGMMRNGDKLASYRLLGEAMTQAEVQKFAPVLLVIGDGEAKAEVQLALQEVDTLYLGQVKLEDLPLYLRAADLMAWPAINEAFGMALLEAQACGLPIVAGNFGGVSGIIADEKTGLLTKPGDAASFASALAKMLADEPGRRKMAEEARKKVLQQHDINITARILKTELSRLP